MTFGRSFGRPVAGRFVLPSVLARAPLNALRSHLYPVQTAPVVEALQQMQNPANLPLAYVLPIKMAQQQWKKYDRWSWQPWSGSIDSYARAFEASGSTLRTIRASMELPPHQEMATLGRELGNQLMSNLVEEDPRQYNPLLRNMQYPTTWPPENESFGVMMQMDAYPLPRGQRARFEEVAGNMAAIRAQDAVYAAYMGVRNDG
jgi:hypothetical protein